MSLQIKGNHTTLVTLHLVEKILGHLQEVASENDIDLSRWNRLHVASKAPNEISVIITTEESHEPD